MGIVAQYNPNFTASYQLVSSYLCPDDTSPAPDQLLVNYTPRKQASYAENRGRQENIYFNWAIAAYPDPGQPYYQNCNYGGGDGMFMPSSVVTVAAVTDGTSNTLLFGEQARFLNEPGASQFGWVTYLAAWGDSYFSVRWCENHPPAPSSSPHLNAPRRYDQRAESLTLALPTAPNRLTGLITAIRQVDPATNSASGGSTASIREVSTSRSPMARSIFSRTPSVHRSIGPWGRETLAKS